MTRPAILTAAVAVVALVPLAWSAPPKHPHMHHALFEMREAHKELKAANHNFGGHREKALEALDAAAKQTEIALIAAGDPFGVFTPPPDIYRGYKNAPHLRHSVVEMREALKEMRGAGHDFGGHREKAIKDIEAAIVQVDHCIEFAK